MLCCHGNTRWKQRIIIVAFLISGAWLAVHGENINNASQPGIALAPEMEVPISVLQSKSPLDPQEVVHDQPPQVHQGNTATTESKPQVVAAPQIPEVEIGPADRDKQNTQQEPQVWDHTTHAQTVLDKKTGTDILTTVGSEANSDLDDDGSGNTEITLEEARTEVASEIPTNFSSFDSDAALPTGSPEWNHGASENFAQTEVVYDFVSATEASSSTTNELDNNSTDSHRGISRNVTAPVIAGPSEQPHFFPTTAYDGHSNISHDTPIPAEAEHALIAESAQMQNSSTASLHLATTPISNVSRDAQHEHLPQHAVTSSAAILSASTETVQSSMIEDSIIEDLPTTWNLSSVIDVTQPSIVSVTTALLDSRGAVRASESDALNNYSGGLNSSFLSAGFQSTQQVPMMTTNETAMLSLSTPFIYHFISAVDTNADATNTSYTVVEKQNAQAINTDSPADIVLSGRINPTKPSSDGDVLADNVTASNVKHADVQLKQENATKSEDGESKMQKPSDIHKTAKTVTEKTISVSNGTASSVQPKLGTGTAELASSVEAVPVTDHPAFTTSIALESPNSTVVLLGTSSIYLSTIQPNQSLTVSPVDSTETIRKNHPTRTPDVDSDHILPTVKIPTTYLSMTLRCSWSHFCLHQDDLRNIFAQYLTNATKCAIKSSQIVYFNTNVCKHVTYSDNEVNGGFINSIVVQMYVANWHGVPSEELTERLTGFLLVKNKLQGVNDKKKLQDVVLAVQLHREERGHTAGALPHNGSGVSGVSDMGIIAAITISGIAGVCLLLLCIMLVVLKRRQILKQQSRRCRPVRADAYSLDSISIYSSFYKRKMRASKRSYLNQGFDDPNAPNNKVNFAGLANLSSDENALAEEYKQIPMSMAKLEDLPPGADLKNRYANVIPFPETRVQLPAKEGDPTSGYINANYVRGFRGDQRTYIACQGPLESTVSDFWEMVWENQCKVIIMLTDWEEEGVAKCFPYFAESSTMDSHRRFGDFQVSTKKIDTRESFTISSLQLKNLEKNLMRDVVHYWYTAWPALGVPSDKGPIVEMLAEARGNMRAASAPTVVHCSPGTGRTGTVLAIHTSMQEYEMSRTVDIPQCVYRLRRDRGGCVQTSEQYRFIYQVLHEFASQFRNPSGRSSIRSSK